MQKYVLDTETSGLKPGFHEITEISILRCEDLEQRVWKLNIHHPERFSKEAIMVTGQNVNSILKRGIYLEDSMDDINDFLKEDNNDADGRVIIAHNGCFDRRQIEHNWGMHKKTFPANYWLDTKEMARKYIRKDLKLQGRQSVALGRLLDFLKIKNIEANAHSAEVDVRNTFRLWKYLEARGISNIEFTKLSPILIKKSMDELAKQPIDNSKMMENTNDVFDELNDCEIF